MSEDLARIEEWFGQIITALSPPERRRAAAKLGRALRKSNLARIAANVQPDGSAMAEKKGRTLWYGRIKVPAGGKMFTALRYARNWYIDADEDGVEIRPANPAAQRVADTNHFGRTIRIRTTADGRAIRATYPERRLLGFSDADEQLALDIAADLLDAQA